MWKKLDGLPAQINMSLQCCTSGLGGFLWYFLAWCTALWVMYSQWLLKLTAALETWWKLMKANEWVTEKIVKKFCYSGPWCLLCFFKNVIRLMENLLQVSENQWELFWLCSERKVVGSIWEFGQILNCTVNISQHRPMGPNLCGLVFFFFFSNSMF